MIPKRITDYLESRKLAYRRLPHEPAPTAPELAASVHVTGRHVAKSVVIEAESQRYIAVLPACDRLDEQLLAEVLKARSVRLLDEPEFAKLFPDCEPGAEPPFGRLFDMPVVLDESLADRNESIVFRAGSHTEALEMLYIDFERIERPIVAHITRETPEHPAPRLPPEALCTCDLPTRLRSVP